jgi:tRNA G18 (ribose-2'-O)-methylase SpoU
MTEDKRNVTDEFRGQSVDAIKEMLDARRNQLEIAVENLERDFNMGTIVRNANAFNIAKVHVIGRKQWNKRGAMATDLYMNVYYHPTVQDFLVAVKGKTVVGVDNIPGSVNLGATELPRECVLVFGAEGPGLSDEMAAACEKIIAIEQFGSTRSVNVGVASGIAMYAWVQRHVLSLD